MAERSPKTRRQRTQELDTKTTSRRKNDDAKASKQALISRQQSAKRNDKS